MKKKSVDCIGNSNCHTPNRMGYKLLILIFIVRALIINDDSCHGSEIVPIKCNRHDQCSKVKRFDVHIIEEIIRDETTKNVNIT